MDYVQVVQTKEEIERLRREVANLAKKREKVEFDLRKQEQIEAEIEALQKMLIQAEW